MARAESAVAAPAAATLKGEVESGKEVNAKVPDGKGEVRALGGEKRKPGEATKGRPLMMGVFFFIVGGFYSEVALQKREAEGTVHTRHQLNLDPNPEGT